MRFTRHRSVLYPTTLPRAFFVILFICQLLIFYTPYHHSPAFECQLQYVAYAQEEQQKQQINQEQDDDDDELLTIAEDEYHNTANRILQQKENNNVCTHQPSTTTLSSSTRVVDQVLTYLDKHQTLIENTILQSYTDHYENVTRPSTQYTYSDFRSSLEYMAKVGVDSPSTSTSGEKRKFYLGPDNCDDDGWHIGLANVAAFLGQSMTMVILNDTW